MRLYDGRNKVIKLFEDKNVKPIDFPSNAKPEYEPEYGPEFEEAIAEKVKRRKQIKDETTEEERSINIELFKNIF